MPDRKPDRDALALPTFARVRLWLLAAIAAVVVGWALKAAGAIAVPLVFAIFLSLVIAPIDRYVGESVGRRWRWLGHVAAMSAILAALLVFLACLWLAAQQVASQFPEDGSGLAEMLPMVGGDGQGNPEDQPVDAGRTSATSEEPAVDAGSGNAAPARGSGGGSFDQLFGALRDAGGNFADTISGWASGFARQIIGKAGALISAAVIVFFLTLLMLIEAPTWRAKLATLLRPNAEHEALESLAVISNRLRWYLLARALLGVITAGLYAAWLWLFNVDLLLVWALIAVLLNFIPTLGSLIAGVLPVLYVLIQRDFGTAVAVGAGIFVIEQIMGNFIDPRVQGHQIALSPLVILVALLLWGWIWGVAGAVLAVPITVTLLVLAAHVDGLRPFALLLSNESDMEGLDRAVSRQG